MGTTNEIRAGGRVGTSRSSSATAPAPTAASRRIAGHPTSYPGGSWHAGHDRVQVAPGPSRPEASPVNFQAWSEKPLVPGGMAPPDRPPGYFAFSSEHPVSPRMIESLSKKYDGNVMIGVDANSDYQSTLKAARGAGARLHVYVEGPGGPTDKEWSSDELARIKKAARGQGIDTSRSDWMKRWNSGPWKDHTFNELSKFKQQGFESAEIDNLYRGLGDSPQRLVDFYRDYAGRFRAGQLPKVLLKNIDGPQMEALGQAVRSGQLPREMFSDFHIFETSAGNPGRPSRLAAELGIRTLISRDTNDYAAFGAYR